MFIKFVIILFLIAILISLFSALHFMFKDNSRTDRMVKALSFRIGLSILLFSLLMAGYYFGIIPAHR